MELSKAIGAKVLYKDYLGIDQIGSIVYIEPYQGERTSTEFGEEVIAWIYISDDENPDNNIHQIIINNQKINYIEIRLSVDVNLLEEGAENES